MVCRPRHFDKYAHAPTRSMNTMRDVQFQPPAISFADHVAAYLARTVDRVEAMLPRSVSASLRSRSVLLKNLPYWGAAFAAAILVVAIVVRPCAQLLHITAVHLWDVVVVGAAHQGSTGRAGAGLGLSLTTEEEALGCNMGLAAVVNALRHMDTKRCPERAMEGDACLPDHQQQPKPAARAASNVSVCPTAALEFEGPTRRLTEWFVPLQQNGSVTCAHTSWFNITSAAPGIVSTTMFGKPMVMWYPSIGSDDARRRGGGRGHKLSLVVFSHLTQKEELLTYRSVVNISYLTPAASTPAPPSLEEPVAGAEMARRHVKLTGAVAHCVQWLLDVYA